MCLGTRAQDGQTNMSKAKERATAISLEKKIHARGAIEEAQKELSTELNQDEIKLVQKGGDGDFTRFCPKTNVHGTFGCLMRGAGAGISLGNLIFSGAIWAVMPH